MRTVKQEYIVKYYDNGNIYREEYKLNGLYHRANGIARKEWYDNGNICTEEYLLNGERHNLNGFAYQSWFGDGRICSQSYSINGKELTKKEFDNRNNCNISGKVVEIDGKKYELKEITS